MFELTVPDLYLKVSQRVRNEQIILVNRRNGFEVKNRAELKICVKRVFFYLFQKLHEEDGLSQFSIFELSVFVNRQFLPNFLDRDSAVMNCRLLSRANSLLWLVISCHFLFGHNLCYCCT